MSRKRARPGRVRPAASRTRNRKAIAITAGAVAVAVVAVVLVLSNIAAPGDEVVATVNGHAITAGDVEHMQARHMIFHGDEIDEAQALERIIVEELVYQEAVPDYRVDSDQAEQELKTQLETEGLTLEWLKAELESIDIIYQEYLETFARELAIGNYLDDAVAVTDEQARERYEEYAEIPGVDLPPFEEVRLQIIIEMEEENLVSLISELREKAEIIRYTDSG